MTRVEVLIITVMMLSFAVVILGVFVIRLSQGLTKVFVYAKSVAELAEELQKNIHTLNELGKILIKRTES